jgi:cyclic pyranopterin phosphate synthase
VVGPQEINGAGAGVGAGAALLNGPRSIAAVRVLRISVTDRCNFRCVYCMPAGGVAWLGRERILSYEEISDVARAAADVHGIRRFKLTGGEPTVRRELCTLVRMLAGIAGVKDLSLTTNGMLLENLARPMREAGLGRITVSLDSLRAERFAAITRTGDLATVLRGIEAAMGAGYESVKINCVTMRGINEDELGDFAALTLRWPVTVRFIEYMPLGEAALLGERVGPAAGCGDQNRGADSLVSEAETIARIEAEFGPLEAVDRASEPGVGPAKIFRLARQDAIGRIGFISAMSAPFCATCNRLRLTADGVLRSCLFDGGEVDVRGILHDVGLASARQRRLLGEAMERCVRLKPDLHAGYGGDQMNRIGG